MAATVSVSIPSKFLPRFSVAVIGLAVLLGPTNAYAERHTFGIQVGGGVPISTIELGETKESPGVFGPIGGAQYLYRLNRYLQTGADLTLAYYPPRYVAQTFNNFVSDSKLQSNTQLLAGVLKVMSEKEAQHRPFFVVGAGVQRTYVYISSLNIEDEGVGLGWFAGAGLNIHVRKALNFEIEGRVQGTGYSVYQGPFASLNLLFRLAKSF